MCRVIVVSVNSICRPSPIYSTFIYLKEREREKGREREREREREKGRERERERKREGEEKERGRGNRSSVRDSSVGSSKIWLGSDGVCQFIPAHSERKIYVLLLFSVISECVNLAVIPPGRYLGN